MLMEADDHHSRHVAPASDKSVPIDWMPVPPRAELVRVRDYTCDCRETVYELCQAGGVRFIRRIKQGDRAPVVEECPTGRAHDIDNLWAQLLSGVAR